MRNPKFENKQYIMNKIVILFLLISSFCKVNFAQEYMVNRSYDKKKVKLKSADLGKNIIAFSPMRFAAGDLLGDGYGYATVGFSYERVFNNEYLSAKLPIHFTIDRAGVLFMPTIKLYPKKQGIVKYAVGPQFLVAFVNDYYYNYYSSYSNARIYDTRRQFGFALNNSLNFTISKHFFLELDASLGILYYDNFKDLQKNGQYYYNDSPLNLNQSFKAGFAMGYRF